MKKVFKKVLFVTTIGGFLPQFEKNDVKLLRELGCEIHYASDFEHPVYTCREDELLRQGIVLHPADIAKSPAKLWTNGRAIRQLRRIIDEQEIDMIHCHNPMGGVAARIAARTSRRQPYVIYTAHGFHFYRGAPAASWLLFYPVERLLAHCTDQIVTINREDYRIGCSFRLQSGGSVTQIHGVGVDRTRFCRKPEIAEAKRRELSIPQDAFHIVTAAELNRNKNQRVVIEALAELGQSDVYYSICGRGPAEQKLRELIREKGLEKNVRLLGFRTDMDEILQTADCFAFPSYREGLGVAAVEALLCGVPLIAADNRGTREYALGGVNSIICRADSVEEFREAIRFLYGNPEERKRMADVCRETAYRFCTEEVEKTMKEVYRRWIDHSCP